MELKDIVIVEPTTKTVVNVVRDISVDRAQTFFPGFTCVERLEGDMHEPGCKVAPDFKVSKRAADVTVAELKAAEVEIAKLDPKLAVSVKG